MTAWTDEKVARVIGEALAAGQFIEHTGIVFEDPADRTRYARARHRWINGQATPTDLDILRTPAPSPYVYPLLHCPKISTVAPLIVSSTRLISRVTCANADLGNGVGVTDTCTLHPAQREAARGAVRVILATVGHEGASLTSTEWAERFRDAGIRITAASIRALLADLVPALAALGLAVREKTIRGRRLIEVAPIEDDQDVES